MAGLSSFLAKDEGPQVAALTQAFARRTLSPVEVTEAA